ncbi:MAG: serine/threonine protein kinase [Deltaproteobacteria bacterium]|nr:serine/threonine protein kinase [Deltaproteobacteria bacterium]
MGVAAGTLVSENVRLLRPLDQGGMGAVWVAEHLTLGMEVAVKFIASEDGQTHPTSRARFEREAKAAASIKSPHVVQMLDHGVMADGTPYIVMELLEGESLAQRLATRGAIGLEETAEIIAQCAKALGAAHDRGVVHRDIKPGNIFLIAPTHEIFVKVLDFGIAKQVPAKMHEAAVATVAHAGVATGDYLQQHDLHPSQLPTAPPLAQLTATGAIVGTPHYMSPEQLLATHEADPRTDIWALGVVAYQALTGRLPFAGDTMPALSMAICSGAFHPPSAWLPGLPAAVDHWYRCVLAVGVEARFPSVRQAAEALRAALPPPAAGPAAVPGVSTAGQTMAYAPTTGPQATAAGPPGAGLAPAATPWPGAQTPLPSTVGGVAGAVDGQAPGRAKWPIVVAASVGAALAAGAVFFALHTSEDSEESDESAGRASDEPQARGPMAGKGPKSKAGASPPQVAGLGEGVDPKRFDPIAFVPRAQVLARKVLPDPVLLTVVARLLDGDGLVDTTKPSTNVLYYFEARGADGCAHVGISAMGINATATTPDYCVTKPLGELRCTLPQVWQRATRKGPPPKGVPGVLSINVQGSGRGTWNLQYDSWTWAGRDDC